MLPKNLEELKKIRTACRRMVKLRAGASALSSFVPIPGADIAADVGLLVELLPAINRKFGLTPEQIDELDWEAKTMLYAVIKKIGTTLVGELITKELVIAALKRVGTRLAAKTVAKMVPIAGQSVAALIGFAAMMYLGNSHVDQCYEIVREMLERGESSA